MKNQINKVLSVTHEVCLIFIFYFFLFFILFFLCKPLINGDQTTTIYDLLDFNARLVYYFNFADDSRVHII